MRYRIRFQIAKECRPGEGRIAEDRDWDKVSSRTAIIELSDSLAGEKLEEAIEKAARAITRGMWRS